MNTLSLPGFLRCLRVNPPGCCGSQGSAVVAVSAFGWYLNRNGGFAPWEKSGGGLGATPPPSVSVRAVGSESGLQFHAQPIGLPDPPPLFHGGPNTRSGEPVVASSVIVVLASHVIGPPPSSKVTVQVA